MQAYQKENEYVPPNPAAPPKQSAKKAVGKKRKASASVHL